MAEALLTQDIVNRVIGQSRLRRLIRAGWLTPVKRRRTLILFAPRDVHAALSRLEREPCPLDQIEVARVRDAEKRHGHAYVPKEKIRPSWDFNLDELS